VQALRLLFAGGLKCDVHGQTAKDLASTKMDMIGYITPRAGNGVACTSCGNITLCHACLQDNHIKAATVAHHVIDHKGDYKIFFSSPLESLCKQCHDNIQEGSKVLAYQRGCDINGKPYKTTPIFIDKNSRQGRGPKRL
jgi:hypothetical protein